MHQVEIELDVPVVMRDGVALRADIYRPAGDGNWPVLLQRTPYGKSGPANWLQLDMIAAVQRGFVVIQQDTRGRLASDGEYLPWAFESQDGYDTVEWASELPFCNGRVGMFGASYTGSTQWTAAISQAPALAAIAPMVTWTDPYDGLFFRGGAIELGLNAAWSLIQSVGQLPKSSEAPEQIWTKLAGVMHDFDALATRTYWELPAAELPALVRTGLPDIGVHRALNDPSTSEECRVAGHHDQVSVPSLNVAGWYDIFQQGSLDNYVAMRERGITSRLVVGPWNHHSLYAMDGGQTGQVNFGAAAAVPLGAESLTDLQLSWFDHWLKDLPASDQHQSGVRIFVMGINQWREEENWPLERAQDTPMYLLADGGLSTEAPTDDSTASSYAYDPAKPVLTCGGATVMSSEFPAGPADQSVAEGRDDVLVFTSAPMTADLEVTGRVRAKLFASTDGPSTDWVVRLCDVDEHGVSRNVVDGIVRASAPPGEIVEHEIDLWSTSIVFRVGHRIRVHVTSSNFPRWDRNLNTGEPPLTATSMRVARQQVFHDRERPSALILPVVPGDQA